MSRYEAQKTIFAPASLTGSLAHSPVRPLVEGDDLPALLVGGRLRRRRPGRTLRPLPRPVQEGHPVQPRHLAPVMRAMLDNAMTLTPILEERDDIFCILIQNKLKHRSHVCLTPPHVRTLEV